jgi:membrane-associated protease RseP (regulator of RpoE activity)
VFLQAEKKNIVIATMLLAITFCTATLAGYGWDLQFRLAAGADVHFLAELANPWVVLRGVPYAVALLFILLCHEMGHFLACRRYGIRSTPPFPIPFPSLPFLAQNFGTMGAFIKIKAPFMDRRQLFDVGVMGPLCGMAAAVPIFLAGLQLSVPSAYVYEGEVLVFGDSLLTHWLFRLFFPAGGDAIALHPLGWAAFFGFLATSINLLPIGQLDGGHIVYAVLGPGGHRIISYACFAGLLGLSILSWPVPGYLPFAAILFLMRLRHPPTLFDEERVDARRRAVALAALAIFLLTFIPIPITIEYY